MAQGKKSVLIYVDWISTFEELEDAEAGRLIKHFFRYVNDLNPEPPDRLTKLVFEPIKQALKRDLEKWESKSESRSESGRLGGIKSGETRRKKAFDNALIEANEANASKTKQIEANEAVIVSVNVNDIVIEEEKENIIKENFDFKKSLLLLGVEKNVASDWLKVRAKKKAANTETAFNKIRSQIQLTSISPNDCIRIAAENSWSGFKAEWLNGSNKLLVRSSRGIGGSNGKLAI